jgi:hypothetical protein
MWDYPPGTDSKEIGSLKFASSLDCQLAKPWSNNAGIRSNNLKNPRFVHPGAGEKHFSADWALLARLGESNGESIKGADLSAGQQPSEAIVDSQYKQTRY